MLWEDVAVMTVTIEGVSRILTEPHVGPRRSRLSTAPVLLANGNLKKLWGLPGR